MEVILVIVIFSLVVMVIFSLLVIVMPIIPVLVMAMSIPSSLMPFPLIILPVPPIVIPVPGELVLERNEFIITDPARSIRDQMTKFNPTAQQGQILKVELYSIFISPPMMTPTLMLIPCRLSHNLLVAQKGRP